MRTVLIFVRNASISVLSRTRINSCSFELPHRGECLAGASILYGILEWFDHPLTIAPILHTRLPTSTSFPNASSSLLKSRFANSLVIATSWPSLFRKLTVPFNNCISKKFMKTESASIIPTSCSVSSKRNFTWCGVKAVTASISGILSCKYSIKGYGVKLLVPGSLA